MSEEERSNLYILTYSDFDDDYVFAESIYTLDDLHNLQKENQQLKEQVEYLRRSIERKESTISEMEQERIPYTNEYVKHLEQQLQQKEDIINKANTYVIENANIYINFMGNKVGFFKRHNDGWTPIELLEILDNKGSDK